MYETYHTYQCRSHRERASSMARLDRVPVRIFLTMKYDRHYHGPNGQTST